MQFVDHVRVGAGYLFWRFLNPADSFNAAYLAGAALFALAVFLWRRRARRTVRLRALLASARRALGHRSSLLDYKLYLVNGLLAVTGYGVAELSSEAWKAGVLKAGAALLGPAGWIALPRLEVAALATLAQVLVLDLAYWATHWVFHNVRFCWELHKVHHSAEVMTPFTEWRQHPIEFIAFANALTFSTGITYGVMAYLFGPGAQPFTLLQLNVVLCVHLFTIHHLRHSGAWIAACGWLGRLVHSPAHHQIHHSDDPAHFGKNLGYALSVWDWAFGTLHMPDRRGRVRLGLGEDVSHRAMARDTLWRPLVKGLAPRRA